MIVWRAKIMRNKIEITKKNNKIHFYFISSGKRYYMFSQSFSKGVYEFFRNGRSEAELYSYKLWHKNPRLDKTIEKIPMYIRYVIKEENAA